MTPADLLQDLIQENLDAFREEMEKAAEELDEVAGPLRDVPPKKVTIRKKKKKSFLAKKAKISIPKVTDDSDEDVEIGDTPKFKLLAIAKEMDIGSGVPPDELIDRAGNEEIPNPRLQMNKMIRRGILYVHLGRVHVT